MIIEAQALQVHISLRHNFSFLFKSVIKFLRLSGWSYFILLLSGGGHQGGGGNWRGKNKKFHGGDRGGGGDKRRGNFDAAGSY